MKQQIPFSERIRKQSGQLKNPSVQPAVGAQKVQQVSFAERVREQARQGGVENLAVLSQRIPLFFQGVAALTGIRSQRENLECWSRWEKTLYQKQYASGTMHEGEYRCFHNWLFWSGMDLTEDDDAEFFIYMLLEPMYWIEEYADTQRGDL